MKFIKSYKVFESVNDINLIVDNYIAGNVKKVRDCEDIKSEIMRFERDVKIKGIFND